MKNFGLTGLMTGLKGCLLTALLCIGLMIVPDTIAVPFSFPQALIVQAREVQPSQSPQPSSTQPSTGEVEETAQPEQATTEQRSTQAEQQRSARETAAPGNRNQGDRTSTQAPYDPYDMNAIRQFDNSWYGQ